jgi:hypothetical protein
MVVGFTTTEGVNIKAFEKNCDKELGIVWQKKI